MLEITQKRGFTYVHKSVHSTLARPPLAMRVSTSASPFWDLNRQQAAAIAEAARAKRISDATEEEASRRRKLPKKLASHSDRAAAMDEMLGQYPNIPLSEYSSDGDHLAINVDFPGLRAIHKDPWIFLVPDLLTQDECEQLMAKAEPHFQDSCSYSNGHRACDECRIARSETQGIQSRYSKLVTAQGSNLCPQPLPHRLLYSHTMISCPPYLAAQHARGKYGGRQGLEVSQGWILQKPRRSSLRHGVSGESHRYLIRVPERLRQWWRDPLLVVAICTPPEVRGRRTGLLPVDGEGRGW